VDIEMLEVVEGERYGDSYPWLRCKQCNWGIGRIHVNMTINDLIDMGARHKHAK
jgi:hypothetical protein